MYVYGGIYIMNKTEALNHFFYDFLKTIQHENDFYNNKSKNTQTEDIPKEDTHDDKS